MDRICTTLVAAGHEVCLVGRLLPDSAPLANRPYGQHRIRCRYTRGKAFYVEYNYRLYREIGRWPADVICAVDLDTLLAGHYLRKRLGCRLVYDAHEWFSETPEVVTRPLIRAAWRRLGRWLVPQTDGRYTVGHALADRLAEDYGVPFATVRNLPRRSQVSDYPTPPDRDARGRRVLLYQGMLNPGRGLDVAIRALAELPDCELWLVGSGPETENLRKLARTEGCADRVWFAGFRPPEELPAYTAAAWLGLNLLDAVSPSYYYSLANKSLDYVQAGLPSVQMDFPEYVRLQDTYNCYLLLGDLEPTGLAGLVRQLITDPPRYAELQRNCRRAAGILNWEQEESVLLQLYAGLTLPPARD